MVFSSFLSTIVACIQISECFYVHFESECICKVFTDRLPGFVISSSDFSETESNGLVSNL